MAKDQRGQGGVGNPKFFKNLEYFLLYLFLILKIFIKNDLIYMKWQSCLTIVWVLFCVKQHTDPSKEARILGLILYALKDWA